MLFGSMTVEVIVGLVFIYLLLSLLCAAAGEYIEALRNNRARLLRKGIELLLNDTSGRGVDLAKHLYDHGLIRPLYRDKTKLPSYIPSRTFALALWNMATTSGGGVTNDLEQIRETIAQLPNEELRSALLTLIDEANGDLARARANIEEWYEDAMDRVSGWYKRYAGFTALVLGITIAAAINADTISLATALARDGALRSAVVAAAEQRLSAATNTSASQPQPQPSNLTSGAPAPGEPPGPPAAPRNVSPDPDERQQAASAAIDRAYDEVKSLGLPIGWVARTSTNHSDLRRVPDDAAGWLLKIIGILLTGFAISQGAPFWFDLLNKFMVIRSTVKPREKSADQPSKDRPAPRTETDASSAEQAAKD
jgi:hypothetical protein